MAARRKSDYRVVYCVSRADRRRVLCSIRLHTAPPAVEVCPYPTGPEVMEATEFIRVRLHPRESHEAVRQKYFGDWPDTAEEGVDP